MRALVREIPSTFAGALTTAIPDSPIDVALARAQHDAYCGALEACGIALTRLPADDFLPDCCFVEDCAIVLEGIALITRPGAPSRRGETVRVAAALTLHCDIVHMQAPATLDGGDCMRVESTIFVGRSARTNKEGIACLSETFAKRGLRVVEVDLPRDVLHLKCVVSPLGEDRILLARDTLTPSTFDAEVVWTPHSEAYAANVVAVGSEVLVADGFPETHQALTTAGFTVRAIPTSEARKADGSLTCQSILW